MSGASDVSALRHERGTFEIYARAIRRHRAVLVLVTLAALLGSFAWLALRSPVYDANAQILVTPLAPDDQTFFGLQLLRDSGDDPTRMLKTASTIVRSPAAAARTAQQMGPGWNIKRVLKQVTVTPVNQSSLLSVNGEAGDARTAARLANTFTRSSLQVRGDVLRRQVEALLPRLRARQQSLAGGGGGSNTDLAARINQLEAVRQGDDPTLSVIEPAAVPAAASGARAPLVVILALIAGVTLGIGAALLLELLNRHVRDEEEAVDLYALPILAQVPTLPRRSRQEHDGLQWNIAPAALEAFRMLLVQLAPKGAEESPAARVIMVTSASTGDGKTTSAINLAMSIAAGGHRTMLVDFDVRKPDVQNMLHLDRAHPLSTLVSADIDDGRLSGLLTPVRTVPNLSVLATVRSSVGDIGLVEALNQRLPSILESARELADFVIVDSAPLGEISDALRIADYVDDLLVVVRPGNTDRTNFEVMRDLLVRTGHRPAGLLVIGGQQRVSTGYYEHGMAVERGFPSAPPPLPGPQQQQPPPRVRIRR
jgi:Mrp family chromosome partitioning ATPase/capsular polysaccharide biosynthesis protein